MATSISGLSSGLDTSTIISQLMQLERIPQGRLQTKQTAMESALGSFRTLNTKFNSIVTAAEKLGGALPGAVPTNPPKPDAWQTTMASSSDATRTSASAAPGAPAGALTFNVRQLATASSHLSASYAGSEAAVHTGAGGVSTTFTLTKSDGSAAVPITTANGTLAETVTAINAAKAGVTASMIQMEPAQGTTPATYRLQLTSTTTGANSTVSLAADDGTDLAPTTMVAGRDAILDLGGGTTISRSSNTIGDVLQGVTLTLTKADTQTTPGVYDAPPLSVTVTKDADGLAAKVQALVDAANSARAEAKSLTAADPVTKVKGRLYGESSVRGLVDQVRSAVPGNVVDTTRAGISVDRSGVISFDKATFLEAMVADPAAVQSALGANGLAGRLHALGDQVSRSASSVGGPGVIAGVITSKESQIESLKSNIASWDSRLAMKEKQLNRTYTGLEVALGKAQSQGAWLSAQLASLPQWSN